MCNVGFIWAGFVQMLMALVITVALFGVVAVPGIVIMVLYVPSQGN